MLCSDPLFFFSGYFAVVILKESNFAVVILLDMIYLSIQNSDFLVDVAQPYLLNIRNMSSLKRTNLFSSLGS